MISTIRSFGLHGIHGYEVSVECFISGGMPNFDVVGLPDAAVKESRDRVRAAIKNCGRRFPVSHIVINLAPADTRKNGTVYDLPVFLGLLAASGEIDQPERDCGFFGELSLTGELRPVIGALPMALAAKRAGVTKLFVPADNAAEAAFAEGLDIYPVSSAAQLLAHLSGEESISKAPPSEPDSKPLNYLDFSEVKGQETAKRALEVAAAGGHNILMVGPPGAGKSMLAKRLPGILPAMSRTEMLESTEIHSVAGLTSASEPVLTQRPFRSPHHTVSPVAVSGGGSNLRPGEISLAHNGVLFLDELPEFDRDVLEVLRQPLEDGRVVISRAVGSVTYPSRFMLVCAMNPCRCGWHGHPSGRCTCTPLQVQRYNSKVSGPLLDRMDIRVEVAALEYEELRARPEAESSEAVRARVNAARDRQLARFDGETVSCNAHMGSQELGRWCALDAAGEALMRAAFERLGLTARSYDRVLRVARTVADLAGEESIAAAHLAEALQYRGFESVEE